MLLPAVSRRGFLAAAAAASTLQTAEGAMRIVDAIDSPWPWVTLDTGNVREAMCPRMERLASQACFVQEKTCFGGGQWHTLDIDDPRFAGILRSNRYQGWVSREFEGQDDPATAVPASFALLRKSFS